MSRYANTYKFFYNDKFVDISASNLNSTFFRDVLKTKIKINANDRLDKLAFDYYDGHGEYWWIIAAANDFYLPTDLTIGSIIDIPLNYRDVLGALSVLNSRQ